MRSLANRIRNWMVFVGVFPLTAVGLLGYWAAQRAIIETEESHLNAALDSRGHSLREWYTEIRRDLYLAANSQCALGACTGEEEQDSDVPACHMLDALAERGDNYKTLIVYDASWKPLVQRDDPAYKANAPPEIRALLRPHTPFAMAPDVTVREGRVTAYAGQVGVTPAGQVRGYVVAILDVSSSVQPFLGAQSGLEATGKAYLITSRGTYVVPPAGSAGLVGRPSVLPERLTSGLSRSVARYQDWRGTHVLGVATALPQIGWTLVVEVDEAEAFRLLNRVTWMAVATGLGALLIVPWVAGRVSRQLSRPLREIVKVARAISGGDEAARAPAFEDSELRDVGQALNQMLDRLAANRRRLLNAASLAAIGELSSTLAHEIRSPLATVKLNLGALARRLSGDSLYRELAEIAQQQADRIDGMIAELLAYARPQQLKTDVIFLGELFEELGRASRAKCEEKDVQLVVHTDPPGLQAAADRELLRRALGNVIENAIQWSPVGSRVAILARSSDESDHKIEITIDDEGPGIPEFALDQLFRPFFSTREEGTGLGLAYVKKIVHQHGGEVAAANRPGTGASFRITLPTGVEEA